MNIARIVSRRYTKLPAAVAMPSPVTFAPCRVFSSSKHSDRLNPPVRLLGEAPWRPCSFTPIHSLTGPVGQPFASRLGGSGSRPMVALTLTMEPGSPVSNVLLQVYVWAILKLLWGAGVNTLEGAPWCRQVKFGGSMFSHMAQWMGDMYLEMSDILVSAWFSQYSSSRHPFIHPINNDLD